MSSGSKRTKVLVPVEVLNNLTNDFKSLLQQKSDLSNQLRDAHRSIEKLKRDTTSNGRKFSITKSPRRSSITSTGKSKVSQLDRLRKKTFELQALLKATHLVSSQSADTDVVNAVVSTATSMLTVEKFTVFLTDSLGLKATGYSTYADSELMGQRTFIKETEFTIDRSTPAGTAMVTKSSNVYDASENENDWVRTICSDKTVEAIYILCAPLIGKGGKMVGALQAINPYDKDGHRLPFQDFDTVNMGRLCKIAGVAINNAKLTQERQHAKEQINGLLRMNRTVSMEIDSIKVLDGICEVSYDLLNADRITIFTKVPGEDLLYISHAFDNARGMYVSSTAGIVGRVATSRQLLSVADAYAHPDFDSLMDAKTGYSTKSILCGPVLNPNGDLLAVVQAINKKDGSSFTDEDGLFLMYVAETAGIALHKAALHEEALSSKMLTEARLKLRNSTAGSGKIDAFLDVAMEEGKRYLGVQRFGVLLVCHNKNELWFPPSITGSKVCIPIGEGISGLVAKTGETICIKDAYQHPKFDPTMDQKTGVRTTSVLCVPIHGRVTDPKRPAPLTAVAMAINKMHHDDIVSFHSTDRRRMQDYCDEIQLALQQLSLEIAYYKVFVDSKFKSPQTMEEVGDGDITQSMLLTYGTEEQSLVLSPSIKLDEWDHSAGAVSDSKIDEWDFDVLTLSIGDIPHGIMLIIQSYNIMNEFDVSEARLNSFLISVASNYRANPFHNIYHATQTLQTTHIMLRASCASAFSSLEVFAILIAAVCHDIDHPGNTNDFEVKSMSTLAMNHNDDAVLERHHCRVTFTLLRKPESNVFEHISIEDFRLVRKTIIAGIMATDMTQHFDLCKRAEQMTRDELFQQPALMLKLIIHAADLSGQALPLEIARQWGSRIIQEFRSQAEKEKSLGLSVAPFMENLTTERNTTNLQVNFINFVLLPLWRPWTDSMTNLAFYLDSLETNFAVYKQELEAIDAKKATGSSKV